MTDTMSAVSAIQSWIANVQSATSELTTNVASMSPTDFASTLEQIQSALSSLPASATQSSDPVSATTALSTTDPDMASTAGATLANAATTGSSTVTGANIASEATQYLGVPYLWGGTTTAGFDCSGFVQYVYGQRGISLPRTSQQQATVGSPIASLSDAQPGDLVFFAGSDGTVISPGHVGIYLGNGEMIDAPETGQDVSIQPVGDPVAIRRIVSTSTADNVQLTSSVLSSTTVPSDLASYFVNAAGQYGVPVQLLTSIASTESNYNPNAVSSAGAEGIMQLMPQTAASLDVNPFDPEQAINGAAQLLSGYLNQFGSVPLALAAYNGRPEAVEQAGGIPPYPQTQAYVQQIMQSLGTSASGSAT